MNADKIIAEGEGMSEQCEHRDIDEHAYCLDCGVEGYWYFDEDHKAWSPK